jgi:tetratricopeptide (TPR) repeat protein
MAKKLNLQELANLSRLLLSEDESSLELGLTLLLNAPKGTASVLNLELILVAYLHPNPNWQSKVYAWLLEAHGEQKMKVWNEGFKIFSQLRFYNEYTLAVRKLVIQHENIRGEFADLIANNRHYSLHYRDIGKLLHYQYKEHLDLVEIYYRIALAANPNDESTLFYLAHLLQVQRTAPVDEVISYYNQVLAINPKESNASLNLGLLYKKLGNYQKAYTCYKEALKIRPTSKVYLRNIASICILIGGDYIEEARQIIKDLTQTHPNDALVWNTWADYLWNSARKYREAEAAYQRGLVIEPDNAYLLGNLGELYIDELGEIDKGLELYEKSIRQEPLVYRLVVMITALVEHKKDWTRAKKYYQQLLASNINHKVERDYALRDDQWDSFLIAEQVLKEHLKII